MSFLLGGLVVLIVVLLLAVRVLVDPNDYKDRIVRVVKEATGRDLQLPGNIKLSVFPWVALKLGPATLGNPRGFSQQPFAALTHAELQVKLLPLLRKQLQVGRIEIDGLQLRLEKNAAGKGNWEDFGATENPSAAGSSASTAALQSLGSVVIKDARVSFEDLLAEGVNLKVGRIAPGAVTPVEMHMRLISDARAQPLDLSAGFDLTPEISAKKYRVTKLELSGTRSAGSAAALQFKFAAPAIDADVGAQTLGAPAFSAQLANAQLAGTLSGSNIIDAPQFSGTFKLAQTSARELITQLGIAVPKTRDPAALSKFAASGSFSYGHDAASVRDLEMQLDDSALRGKAAVTDLKSPAMSFDLALDHIDFDRYRPPEAPPAKLAAKHGESSPASLRSLRLEGSLTVGSARVAGMQLTQLSVAVAAKDGVIHLTPVKAKLYGGDYAGTVTLDARGEAASLNLDQVLTNVDVASLGRDFAKSSRISGRGRVTTNLTAVGEDSDSVLRTLGGHASLDLIDGAVEGVDLWFEINRAMALVQQQPPPAGQSSGRTKFDTFKGSADFSNGVATTKDLSIISQNLRIAGQGTAHLVSGAINFQVNATILKKASTGAVATGNVLAEIPLLVSGTLANPKVSPDLEGMAKARIQHELDTHKDELKQKLQDQLKGIFK